MNRCVRGSVNGDNSGEQASLNDLKAALKHKMSCVKTLERLSRWTQYQREKSSGMVRGSSRSRLVRSSGESICPTL